MTVRERMIINRALLISRHSIERILFLNTHKIVASPFSVARSGQPLAVVDQLVQRCRIGKMIDIAFEPSRQFR